jgi:glycosyltransferase involved in cell wall biosynthesis
MSKDNIVKLRRRPTRRNLASWSARVVVPDSLGRGREPLGNHGTSSRSLMPPPTISVAITTFNGAKFLDAQLESIANQTLQPTEVIICDDRSEDSTPDIIQSFAKKYGFKVIPPASRTLGYRANFKKAIAECCGDLITTADQDNVWDKTRLARCIEPFKNGEVLLTYHNATVTDQDLNPIHEMDDKKAPRKENPPLTLPPWHIVEGFTQTFRREPLIHFLKYWRSSVDPFDPKEREAYDQYFLGIASALGSIVYLDESLIQFRQHSANICGYNNLSEITWQKIWAGLKKDQVKAVEALERASKFRASLFESVPDSRYAQHARNAARMYRKMEERYALRREMLEQQSLLNKFKIAAKALHAGAYGRPSRGGAGLKHLVADAAFACRSELQITGMPS